MPNGERYFEIADPQGVVISFAELLVAHQAAERTLSSVVERLARRGFTAHFAVVAGKLHAFEGAQTFEPGEVIIREYHRFEGVSDPDDMSIVYAIESLNGTRGCLVDAFGVYSSPVVSAFLQEVPIRRTARVPAAADV
jgi:hypothetical protein